MAIVGQDKKFWAQLTRLFPQLAEMRGVRAVGLSVRVNEGVVLSVEVYADPNLSDAVITRRYRLEEWPEEERGEQQQIEKNTWCRECGEEIQRVAGFWMHLQASSAPHHPATPMVLS